VVEVDTMDVVTGGCEPAFVHAVAIRATAANTVNLMNGGYRAGVGRGFDIGPGTIDSTGMAAVGPDSVDSTAHQPPSMRTFFVVWGGQLVSLVGTSLTAFALSIYVFQQTGSVTQLAMVLLAAHVPALVITPFAGALVDRWDRRKAMILADAGAGIGTILLVALYFTGSLAMWSIAIAVAISGLFQAFQWPAYTAAMAVLVPKEQFGRASGLVQLAEAFGELGGPILAGFALAFSGIGLVFAIDVATFLFAVGTLLMTRFPKPVATAAGAAGTGSLWHETKYGFHYVAARHGLLALLFIFAVINFAFGFLGPLFVPLGLSLTSEAGLGTSYSISATGMLIGSLIASAWGGPTKRVRGVIICGALLGVVFAAIGLYPSIYWMTVVIFFGMMLAPTFNATSQAIWLAKVEADLQGRVSAVRRFISQAAIPVAYVLVGPLSDNVFEPLMADDGPWADTVGRVIGSGPGRGYALFFVVIGVGVFVAILGAWMYPPLRHLERDVPDAAQTGESTTVDDPMV
jgi:MFS family permease